MRDRRASAVRRLILFCLLASNEAGAAGCSRQPTSLALLLAGEPSEVMGLFMAACVCDQLFHAVTMNHPLAGAKAMSRIESRLRRMVEATLTRPARPDRWDTIGVDEVYSGHRADEPYPLHDQIGRDAAGHHGAWPAPLLSECVQPAWPIGLWRWCAWVSKLPIDNAGHMNKASLYRGLAGKPGLGKGWTLGYR